MDGGSSALAVSDPEVPAVAVTPGLGQDSIQATILSYLINQLGVADNATFEVDYSVSDGHGNTASNIVTFTFEGAGTLLASATSGDVGGPPVSGSAASGGLQFTSTIDATEALAVGCLGGPTDLTTISSWVEQMLSSGLTLSQLAASIATEFAATAEYPFLANPQSATPTQVASFVDSVYENVFARAPTPTELTNAENELTANLSNSQYVDTFILDLILGAQGQDQTTVLNQIAAAEAVLSVEQDYLAITRTDPSLSQATTIANGINASPQTQTETQYINGLLSQVANTMSEGDWQSSRCLV